MSNVVNGTQIMLYINDAPVFAGVSNDESAKNDLRETTSKMSGGVAEYQYGKFSAEGTAEGLFAENCKNLALYSEDFSKSVWAATGCTKTANYGTAPNGKKVSGRITAFSNGDSFEQTLLGTTYNLSSTDYTFSVWVKGTAGQTITLKIADGGSMEQSLLITLTTSFVRYSVSGKSTGDNSNINFGVINSLNTATAFELAQPQIEIGTLTDYQQSGILYSEIFNIIKNKSTVSIKTGSLISGTDIYTGTALISDLKRTEALEGNTTFSLSYKITGQLTKTTI